MADSGGGHPRIPDAVMGATSKIAAHLDQLKRHLHAYLDLGPAQARLKLYEEKLERFNDLNKAPLKPSSTLNRQAAARFIEHSLPDLTPEQKRSMRGIVRDGNRDCLDQRSG